MRLDSIRYRLIALIGICLFGMVALVVTQVININRLIDVQTDATLLLELNNEILQLRRHEKDFMLRQNMDYVVQFDRRAELLSVRLDDLEQLLAGYSLPANQLEDLRARLSQYRSQFSSLAEVQVALGLNENSGQQGTMRRFAHQLEDNLNSDGDNGSILKLLQLRRLEKDFIQRHDMDYVASAATVYGDFQRELRAGDQTENLELLNNYYSQLMEVVAAYQRIGLNPETGIQGGFRDAAHNLEQQLASLSETLTPLITQREQDVKIWGFIIAIVTVAVLLTLLIRNLITLQTTLSTFLLFFHQSKREYQMLDAKKMGFAEFRSLAQVANEMVNARRDMESELRDVKQKLTDHEARDQTSS